MPLPCYVHVEIIPGVHPAFLPAAHTPEDVDTIIEAFKRSFPDLREDGLFRSVDPEWSHSTANAAETKIRRCRSNGAMNGGTAALTRRLFTDCVAGSTDRPGFVDHFPHPAEMLLRVQAAAERSQAQMGKAGIAPTLDPRAPLRLPGPHHGHSGFHADAFRVAARFPCGAVDIGLDRRKLPGGAKYEPAVGLAADARPGTGGPAWPGYEHPKKDPDQARNREPNDRGGVSTHSPGQASRCVRTTMHPGWLSRSSLECA